MLEKVADLVDQDRRHLLVAGDIGVKRVQLVHRHGQDLFVLAGFVLHEQDTDRARADDHTGIDRRRTDHQNVAGVAVIGQGMRDEAVIARIVHRGIEETVDEQRAGVLVHFVFHGHAALRDFDDGVDVPGRVVAYGNLVNIHGVQSLCK